MVEIYRALLRLYPRQYRERFGEEMAEVFAAAAAQARSRGVGAYVGFCAREASGLAVGAVRQHIWGFSMKSRYWILASGVVGMAIATLLAPPLRYRSQAVLRIVQPFPEAGGEVARSNRMAATQHGVRTLGDVLMSRHSLHNIILTYKLYTRERERMPMEDVIERMRRDITVAARGDMIELSFSYGDRVLAQKVARDLMTRIIESHVRERSVSSKHTASFLKQQAEKAAAEWARQFEALRKVQPGTAQYERLAFDRDLARRHYEQLRTQEFEGAAYRSPTVEALDLPNLPEEPVGPGLAVVLVGGLAAGLAVGWAVTFLLSIRAHRLLPREV